MILEGVDEVDEGSSEPEAEAAAQAAVGQGTKRERNSTARYQPDREEKPATKKPKGIRAQG